MYSHNATLYPMLAVGAFMSMFWTGIVVAHELGLGCVSMLIMGLLSACLASVGICELQRRERGGPAACSGARAAPAAASGAGGTVRQGIAPSQALRPPALMAPGLVAGPTRTP